ncbi:MAG: Cys-tRNA(Pro) deacylase [Solobacterium sp.]|nr:Cys-tRNA(Pro) deacylase [Solobacterium sp.]
MAKKEEKTNVLRILDKAKIDYIIHKYDTEDGEIDGVSVANKCNEDPRFVYKTLVTRANTKDYYVFVIPVEKKLDVKKAAKAASVKSIQMIAQKELLPLTGYIHGGCSPIDMKRFFPTFVDISAKENERIYISAGKVGIQVELKREDFERILLFTYSDITME